MNEILQRDTNTITIANFWENHLLGKYNYNPAYQRKSVWSEEKQSFFIDSIIRNFPIPPIFLHQHIDDTTGKTLYDVIDGKQRLESIINFINGSIPVSIESETEDDETISIAGKFFKDLDAPELQDYKKRFWRYVMPIEYIDTTSIGLIDRIFDRLNRNGAPLEGQELRHAQYHSTELLKTVREFASEGYWKERLEISDVSRMEDQEFISELVFVILEGTPLQADQKILDGLYEKYAKKNIDWAIIREKFFDNTNFLKDLDLEYKKLKIGGMSHLYGLWCFSAECVKAGIAIDKVKDPLKKLFEDLRNPEHTDETVEQYRKTMAFNTRSRSQRVRRLEAIKKYVGISN